MIIFMKAVASISACFVTAISTIRKGTKDRMIKYAQAAA